MGVRLGLGGLGSLLRMLTAAVLIGGKAREAETLIRQDGAHLGCLALEDGGHAAADVHVCVAVAHPNV